MTATGRAGADASAVAQATEALLDWYRSVGSPRLATFDWARYEAMIAAVADAIPRRPVPRSLLYEHPVTCQHPEFGIGKPYPVPTSYSDSETDGEVVIAIGGLVNVVQRFDFMASDAAPALRILSLDLAGRGLSGWLVDLSDYGLDTYVEQLRQFMDTLRLDSCTLCGSSLGGSIAIRFAARHPDRVRRLVLNDSAPYIPVERRARRAKAVARHYVFRRPDEMIRKTAAASKHFGAVPEAVLLHTGFAQTCWSETEGGRIYRHDLRALLAYREEARVSLDLWEDWAEVECPVLLLHGMLSDATSEETIEEMRASKNLSVLHIADTGHTPTLSDSELTAAIVEWIQHDQQFASDRYFQPRRAEQILRP